MAISNTDVFDKDSTGQIITNPLTGFNIAPVAEMAVLCQLQYVSSPEELAAGRSRRLQLVLTPQQARELAAVLTKQAERIETVNQSLPIA